MIFTTLFRVVKYGLDSFKRNGWLSTATIAIVFLVLVAFGALLIFNKINNILLTDVQDKVDISVYFEASAPEDDILKIQRSLESMPVVKSVEYISKDKALEIFREQHKDDTTISESLAQIGSNPLGASLNVRARELKDYAEIAAMLEGEQFESIIDNVSYTQNVNVIDRLKRIKNTMERGGLAVLIFVSVIAALIIFNTVRLAIYSNRDELSIMRLVGASNFFIRGPYLIVGLLYGVFGSILALIVISALAFYTAPHMQFFINDGWQIFTSNIGSLFLYLFGFGVGLGVVSSYVAVRRYLKI